MTDTPVSNEVAKRVTLKAYSSAVINPGAPVDTGTDPGDTGGQVLRRVSSVMAPQINEFQSEELNTAQQVKDVRHGGVGVTITMSGEISPGTYELPMQAVMRCTPWAISTKTQSDFTSLAASNADSTFTVGSSTWAALGYFVGMPFRPTGTTGDNDGKNFWITALNDAVATVWPAPTDLEADTTCSITVPGKKFTMPDPPIKSKWLLEHYSEDTDLGELAEEFRFGKMTVTMDEKVSTIEFTGLGRKYTPLDSGSAPFFASPTAPTTAPVVTTFGGVFLINGVPAAVISKANLSVDLKASKQDIAFIKYSPEIFTGKAAVSGSFDAMPIDNSFKNLALNETETGILFVLTTADTGDSDFVSFYMSLTKLGQFTETGSGEAGISNTHPFTAYQPISATGIDPSTLVVYDSLAA